MVSWLVGGKLVLQDEVDEIEVYGSEVQLGIQLVIYFFEVCDSIFNIGFCVNVVMGEFVFFFEEFQNSFELDLEIVVCFGYGKNGVLLVLQKSIWFQVVIIFEFFGCYDMWIVIVLVCKEEEDNFKGEGIEQEFRSFEVDDDGCRYGFLILSWEDLIMILQMGQEIMELDISGFVMQGFMVFVGNIGDNCYIV